jgi:hypothetical protein
MHLKKTKILVRIALNRETLQFLAAPQLGKAAAGVSLKCPETQTGLARPQCIC